jgi:hypothetical protein
MKNILSIVLSFFILQTLKAQNDSGLIEKNGWLLYWKDAVVWVHADIKNCVKDRNFFQSLNGYKNGLVINYIPNALYYKSVAKGYSMQVKSKGYNATDSVWILPAKVKYKIGFEADKELTVLDFIKDSKAITVEFSGNADYDIRSLQILRKSDMRKLKRVKD